MKRSSITFLTILSLILVTLFWPAAVRAADSPSELTVSTTYPSEVIQLGESVTLSLNLSAADVAQTINMQMEEMPDGWSATFRGGGRIVQSVFVNANSSGSVDLRLDPPTDAKSGTYNFLVLAQSEAGRAELPIRKLCQ